MQRSLATQATTPVPHAEAAGNNLILDYADIQNGGIGVTPLKICPSRFDSRSPIGTSSSKKADYGPCVPGDTLPKPRPVSPERHDG
jgi:hypothetical protein